MFFNKNRSKKPNKIDSLYAVGYVSAMRSIYGKESPLSYKDKRDLVQSHKEKASKGDPKAKGFMDAIHENSR